VHRGPGQDGTLRFCSGKLQHRLQASRDPTRPPSPAAEGGGQPVPAAAIAEPGPSDLPVVGAGGDELGQGQLVQAGRPICQPGCHRIEQPRWHNQPAEPQSRSQALAGRPRVDHTTGCERLQGADRLPVITEFPVVVVLDHQAAPAGHLMAAAWMQRRAQRELMRRGQQHCVRIAGRADHGAPVVDGHRPQPQSLPAGDSAVRLMTVGFDRERTCSVRAQHAADGRQPMREAAADHDAAGIGDHAAGPGQVIGQGHPQLRQAARIGIAEEMIGRGREHPARGRQPGPAREGRQIGHPGSQVIAGHARLGGGRRGSGTARAGR
jgi:hypothetical protein